MKAIYLERMFIKFTVKCLNLISSICQVFSRPFRSGNSCILDSGIISTIIFQ